MGACEDEPMNGRWLTLIAAALVTAATAACSSALNVPVPSASGSDAPSSTGPVAATVTLINVSFAPAVVNIHAGQTVEWKWQDGQTPHNVTFDTFHSATKISGTYFHTFNAPGVYHYSCTIHINMSGTVVVR
jgi:plastocyanin